MSSRTCLNLPRSFVVLLSLSSVVLVCILLPITVLECRIFMYSCTAYTVCGAGLCDRAVCVTVGHLSVCLSMGPQQQQNPQWHVLLQWTWRAVDIDRLLHGTHQQMWVVPWPRYEAGCRLVRYFFISAWFMSQWSSGSMP